MTRGNGCHMIGVIIPVLTAMAIVPPLIMKLAMTISPTPASPRGRGGKVSLREFHVNLAARLVWGAPSRG